MPEKQRLPLVTVICLCYNQARFVRAALDSVLEQTYSRVELIVVDDGSTDGSAAQIEAFCREQPAVIFLKLPANRGMCAAFNQGLRLARGEYIIDLAADDRLLPHRIARQVAIFEALDASWGVVFTDAEIIDESGKVLQTFYDRRPGGQRPPLVPAGDVYVAVLQKHFICSPTMMSRRAVYEALGGYDESLCYEDFDFWVRSARYYRYYFLDEVLTQKRKVAGSDSTQWYRRAHNPHLQSTLVVCEKAFQLNRNPVENQALARTVRYHLRQALFTENFELVAAYDRLLRKITSPSLPDQVWRWAARYRISLYWAYKIYLKRRYNKLA